MQFKVFASFLILALAAGTQAAPATTVGHSLLARAVKITVTFRSSSGLQPADPATLSVPKSTTLTGKALAAAQAKAAKKAAEDKARDVPRKLITERVQALLDAAEVELKLPKSLAILVTDQFHENKGTPGGSGDSDQENHCTFQFVAPACGGTCIGHAYNTKALQSPGKGQPGKIFKDGGTGVIFGGTDI